MQPYFMNNRLNAWVRVFFMEAAIDDLGAQPESWPEIEDGIRRRPLRRFPYSVLYRIDKDEIVIVAVMHQRRHPRYWAERVK
jgi:plasmid stabilization system protein ParE